MTEKRVARGRGLLAWISGEEARAWRAKARRDVFNTEGRKVVLESSFSTDKSIDPVAPGEHDGDTVFWEKPKKLNPSEWASPREVVESEAAVVAEHWLLMKRTNPEAFRRKMADLRALDPIAYSHMNDDQLEAAIVEVCRRAVVERVMAETWDAQGFASRVWRSDISQVGNG
ncbi:MAG TPA: hypothetical protein VF377_06885 [Acidimicrobiia bacterium]